MSNKQTTYEDVYNRRLRQEGQAFEADEQRKLQAQIDFNWQCKLDAEAALREEAEWIIVGGFLERRKSSCHKSKRDPDYWL